jgi:hypothetical protein
MRAIIHSVHSQVPRTIEKLGEDFDVVLSLDSHLDVSLGGDDRIYPKQLQMIARRTGAHTAIRELIARSGPKDARLIVAIPERMLTKHATDIEANLPSQLRLDSEASVASVVDFLREERGIEVFQSPPESLQGLIRHTKTGSWLLDVDMDYMQEMQKECYTRVYNLTAGVLQSMTSVVRFIRLTRPDTITLSEARVSAIRDPESAFSKFRRALEGIGYQFEERDVVGDDAQVVKGIAVCKEFYRTVSKNLMAEHMEEMMQGDFRGFWRDERSAARTFFAAKGYRE